MVFLSGGHYAELEETLGAGLPVILATIATRCSRTSAASSGVSSRLR